eukprot:Amastigsp_a174973_75.p3 type:complete len:214 gc:universal Amastigsp_a174973_75:1708-2349(+)
MHEISLDKPAAVLQPRRAEQLLALRDLVRVVVEPGHRGAREPRNGDQRAADAAAHVQNFHALAEPKPRGEEMLVPSHGLGERLVGVAHCKVERVAPRAVEIGRQIVVVVDDGRVRREALGGVLLVVKLLVLDGGLAVRVTGKGLAVHRQHARLAAVEELVKGIENPGDDDLAGQRRAPERAHQSLDDKQRVLDRKAEYKLDRVHKAHFWCEKQ